MEAVFAAGALWRHRWLVLLGLAPAIAIGLYFASRPAVRDDGAVATVRLVLDTPKSQLLNAASPEAESLAWRARMLASLLTADEYRKRLATGIGVRVADVEVLNSSYENAGAGAPIPVAASKAMNTVFTPYVLTASVPNRTIPVVLVSVYAPDTAAASKLATVAAEVLKSQSTRAGTYRSEIVNGRADSVLEAYDVEQVAPVQVEHLTTRSHPALPVGIGASVFVAWCAAIILILAPLRRWLGGRTHHAIA